jgi:hypothetical protein
MLSDIVCFCFLHLNELANVMAQRRQSSDERQACFVAILGRRTPPRFSGSSA